MGIDNAVGLSRKGEGQLMWTPFLLTASVCKF